MSYFTVDDLRKYHQRSAKSATTLHKSMEALLGEASTFVAGRQYDIFLSHSIKDREAILGIKDMYEDQGKTVYVDWIEDKELDRAKVNAETAGILRQRMKASKSLVYVASNNAKMSVWMPWEVGYFDGLKGGNVSIMPVEEGGAGNFAGQEYLELYPVIEKVQVDKIVVTGVSRKAASGQRTYDTLGGFLGTGRPAKTNFLYNAR